MDVDSELQTLLEKTSACLKSKFDEYLNGFKELSHVYAETVLTNYKKELHEYILTKPSYEQLCTYLLGDNALIDAENVNDIPVTSIEEHESEFQDNQEETGSETEDEDVVDMVVSISKISKTAMNLDLNSDEKSDRDGEPEKGKEKDKKKKRKRKPDEGTTETPAKSKTKRKSKSAKILYSEKELNSMTNNQLKEILRSHKLSLTGPKSELVKRILDK